MPIFLEVKVSNVGFQSLTTYLQLDSRIAINLHPMNQIKLSHSLSAIEDNFKGRTVSFLSFVFIFGYLPILMKYIWPTLLEKIGNGTKNDILRISYLCFHN